MVRSHWGACRVAGDAPYDTVHYRIYHRARPTGSDHERNTGEIPPDTEGGPFPVVVFCIGMNVPPDGYGWLARRLAEAGFPTVLYQLVAEHLPGMVGCTPGIDITAVTPDTYPNRPVCPALRVLIDDLASAPIPLDTKRVILGGHSAGGTAALLSAQHLPECIGVFVYGAHSGASTMLGWPERTVLPINSDVPVLLMTGTDDEVISASAGRYGEPGESPVDRTFHECIGSGFFATIEGAGHFGIVDPVDHTTARAFLEKQGGADATPRIGDLVSDFCSHVASGAGLGSLAGLPSK